MSRTKKGYVPNDSMVEAFKDVARHYGRDMSTAELAKKHGLSVEKISPMATKLRSYGVDVAMMKRGGLVVRAVDDLRRESPELFAKQLAPVKKAKRKYTKRANKK